jgi:hypothetical protein
MLAAVPPKRNPLKLNPLQLRTLALLQELARDGEAGRPDANAGDVAVAAVPVPHGDHVHVGRLVVSARAASGLANPSVWAALERKGLLRDGSALGSLTLTRAGIEYETGLEEGSAPVSDH